MEDIPDVPEEFIGPIIPCLNLLKNGSIHFYAVQTSFWKKNFSLCLNVVSLFLYLLGLTTYLGGVFKGKIQLNELAYVVSVYVVCVQATLKATIVIFNKKEIKAIILQLGGIWRTQDLTDVQINKKNVMLKRLKLCYADKVYNAAKEVFTSKLQKNDSDYVFYWINMIGSWQYILAPLLETVFRKFILQQECGLLLPFSCSFPFDPTGNWPRYIGVYIFETYSMFRVVFFYLGTEFLMITLCSHLSTEFTLLHEDLLNVQPGNFARLKIVIEKHQTLIRLVQQLDDIFDKVIIVDLTSTSISICFFGLSAMVSHGFINMFNNFVAVFSLILPLFNLCYYGELLREASAGIADSMYNNPWYQGDIRYQKLLCFILKRSQKPCCLTSLKYTPITLNTFTTVLRTTWSYFSLVSTVYDGEY